MGGKNPVKMDALQNMYEGMGFDRVKTYIQSGNVVFNTPDIEPEKLHLKIAQQIEKEFGFVVPVIVLAVDSLQQIIDNNPFLKDPYKDHSFLHVTFLSSKPDECDIEAIDEKKQTDEEIVIADQVVYLYCPNGYGRTKLNNTFLETKLRVEATTRNRQTTNELLKIALSNMVI